MDLNAMPWASWDSMMAAEFPADKACAARSLISEIRTRLDQEKFQHFKDTLPRLAFSPTESPFTAEIVDEILDGQTDLIAKFHAFFPGKKKKKKNRTKLPAPPASEIGFPQVCPAAVEFVKKLRRRDKQLQRSVLEVLDSCNRGEIGKDDFEREITELLKGDPQLLREFAAFFPVTEATPISVNPCLMEEGEIRHLEGDEQRNPTRAKSSEHNPNSQLFQEFATFSPATEETPTPLSPLEEGEIRDLEDEEEQRNPNSATDNLEQVTEATPISVNPYLTEEGGTRDLEAEEQAKSSESNPNNEILRNKIFNSAVDNLELSLPILYRYSKGISYNPANLSVELKTLFRLKPIENDRKRKRRTENEIIKTRKTTELLPRSKKPIDDRPEYRSKNRITPSYKLLLPEKKNSPSASKDPALSVLNTTYVSAPREYSSGGGRRMMHDRAVEVMNEIEEDRYNLDMVGVYLNSAADYLDGKKEKTEDRLGKIYLRKCVETMYDSTEEVVEMAMEDPEFLDRIVKKRVHQKSKELQMEKKRLEKVWRDAIAAEHCKSVIVGV